MGDLEGIFISTPDRVRILTTPSENDIEVRFGEVLGKHSEISETITAQDITLVTDDPAAVEIFKKYEMWCGYDPFAYPCDEDSRPDECKDKDMTTGQVIDVILAAEPKE